MFGTKWQGDIVVVHTGIFAREKRKAIKKAAKHGYSYAGESTTSVTFRRGR